MIFTDQDLQVLTNFSEINQNFIFKKGKTAMTISTMKNILAHYEMETEVPKEFGIYDLRDFLNVYDLFDFIINNYEDLPDRTFFCRACITFPQGRSKPKSNGNCSLEEIRRLINKDWVNIFHRVPQMPIA